jgi:hypothetical protein
MTANPLPADPEFEAIQSVLAALGPLDEAARGRVMGYIASRLGIAGSGVSKPADGAKPLSGSSAGNWPASSPTEYATFAELCDAARPQTNVDQALVSGYWLQVCQKADSFDGQNANKELKHLGHSVPNITRAIDGLRAHDPAFVIQLKKSGSSQQSRKLYKVTVAGVREVERMISAQ